MKDLHEIPISPGDGRQFRVGMVLSLPDAGGRLSFCRIVAIGDDVLRVRPIRGPTTAWYRLTSWWYALDLWTRAGTIVVGAMSTIASLMIVYPVSSAAGALVLLALAFGAALLLLFS